MSSKVQSLRNVRCPLFVPLPGGGTPLASKAVQTPLTQVPEASSEKSAGLWPSPPRRPRRTRGQDRSGAVVGEAARDDLDLSRLLAPSCGSPLRYLLALLLGEVILHAADPVDGSFKASKWTPCSSRSLPIRSL